MTLHRKQNPKREKSKIILPLQTYTTLLPKKRKITKFIKKTDKIKTDIYTKIKHNNSANALKNKNISTIHYKVHSTCKQTFNKA